MQQRDKSIEAGYPLRVFYIAAGWVALGLGVLGAFLPLLPTTPLVLLAGFCFSRGSKRLHNWLREQSWLGPRLIEWEEHRVIRRKAKVAASGVKIPVFAYLIGFTSLAIGIKIILAFIGVGLLIFIWSRPSTPPAEKTTSSGDY